MQIYQEMNKPEFIRRTQKLGGVDREIREEAKRLIVDADFEDMSELFSLGNFYGGIGVLVYNGRLDVELVGQLMSPNVIRTWETFEPVVEMIRTKVGNPAIFDNFEYLYRAMKSRTPVNYVK